MMLEVQRDGQLQQGHSVDRTELAKGGLSRAGIHNRIKRKVSSGTVLSPMYSDAEPDLIQTRQRLIAYFAETT